MLDRKGDSNIMSIVLIVGGFLIVTFVIVLLIILLKTGTDTGAKCVIRNIFGVSDPCKVT